MKTRSLFISAFVAFAMSCPASAQLAAPNSSGVALGHVHLAAKDVDAERSVFIALGGTPVSNGAIQMIQFPGIFINVRQDTPTGGSVGSNVNHFGFHVKSLAETVAKLKPMGFKLDEVNPHQAFVFTPGGARIELLEDTSISSPVEMHHIHMFATAPIEVQSWYVKNFGGTAGKRGAFDTAVFPGGEISLTKQDTAQAPTKGRSVDHIGFEVKNLDQFVKKLETSGVKIDIAPRLNANGVTKTCFLTDPWGTYVELTENLSPPAKH